MPPPLPELHSPIKLNLSLTWNLFTQVFSSLWSSVQVSPKLSPSMVDSNYPSQSHYLPLSVAFLPAPGFPFSLHIPSYETFLLQWTISKSHKQGHLRNLGDHSIPRLYDIVLWLHCSFLCMVKHIGRLTASHCSLFNAGWGKASIRKSWDSHQVAAAIQECWTMLAWRTPWVLVFCGSYTPSPTPPTLQLHHLSQRPSFNLKYSVWPNWNGIQGRSNPIKSPDHKAERYKVDKLLLPVAAATESREALRKAEL